MRKIILYTLFYFVYGCVSAQPGSSNSLEIFNSCETAQKICGKGSIFATFNDPDLCLEYISPQYFRFNFSQSGSITLNTITHSGIYTLYGPMDSYGLSVCQQISLGQVIQVTGNLSGVINIPHDQGYYVLRVLPINCVPIVQPDGTTLHGVKIDVSARNTLCVENVNCKDCISSFSPDPGEYIISAWVKGKEENINETSYVNPEIQVNLSGGGNPTTYSFLPSGLIIDGWQRIDGKVTIPQGSTGIEITLNCLVGDCYFDDIRFVPIDGSMKSYVYDPVTMKLVAELDERNYATFYEYDEEGKLIRVKKETEKGIMTIQENRDNISK